jgi:coenzyme F420-reducing hydrogenase gamma subunit
MENGKKLRIGWFTFTCCEDSTIVFTELLNTHYKDWFKQLDFIHAKVLQTNNRWDEMDVAFVEGAISTDAQAEKLKKIRSLAKKLVAIGACANTGMPSAQRNQFDSQTKEEIRFLLEKFHANDNVQKLDEVVTVDERVQGCPMMEQGFINVLNKYLNEFNITSNRES